VRDNLPHIRMTRPEGTYLAWLDCGDLKLEPSAYQFFLDKAQVALSNGVMFGEKRGQDFVRLNFACSRDTLFEGLNRLRAALTTGD
jgi:cystathionine beta-lyase